MIERTFDSDLVNRICNHPDVRPWLGGEGEIDLGPVLADTKNYALFGPEGGFILHAGPGASFEVHSQFTPEGRNSSIRAMLAGMDYMFTRTQCLQITTFLPDANPRAKAFGRIAGFRDWFRRDNHICGPGMQGRIDIDDWIARTADLEKDGERFHHALEGAGGETNHAHDSVHERYVGAAYRMFERGQSRKAEALYNRWAANAGYVPVKLISDNPPVVDTGNAVVTLDDGQMKVLETMSCQ
jgi:hypothetical protein